MRGNRVSRPEIENWSSGKEVGSSYLEFCHLAIKLIHFLGAAVLLQPQVRRRKLQPRRALRQLVQLRRGLRQLAAAVGEGLITAAVSPSGR